MAVLTCSFLSTLLCLCPCEPLLVFSSCVYGSFFLSHFQDSVLLCVPNWLLLFPQPFPANSTLFPWWPLLNLRSLPMFPNLYALSPCHHSPFVLKSTLTSVCPALASVFPILWIVPTSQQSLSFESSGSSFLSECPIPFLTNPSQNPVGFSCLLLSNLHCPLFSS